MMKELVVTDVLAAALLLRAEQKRIREETVKELTARAVALSDPAMSPLTLYSDGDPMSPASHRVQSFLWGPLNNTRVKLKAQTFASSTPVSPRGSWISNLMASEGRVADPARRMEAFRCLEEFADYTGYQEGIYGWKLFFYSSPLKFLTSFKWLNTSWLSSKRPEQDNFSRKSLRQQSSVESTIEGRVFAHVAGLEHHHVIYASFTAYLGESVPYTICVDHERQSVVIAIRGTMSFADLVLDLMLTPVELDAAGRQWGFDGNNQHAHSGMLQIANRIRFDIEKQEILSKLFNLNGGDQALPGDRPVPVEGMFESEAYVTKEDLKKTNISHYQLMVVGHSLGGGIAAILSLLLRPKFPRVRCLAYEPPGCIFSKDLADASNEWINAVVCGVDSIPRLGWHNAKRLRGQLLEMLRRCKVNKAKVFSSIFWHVPATDLLYELNKVPKEEERENVARMIQKLAVDTDSALDKYPLFLPGKILHLAKGSTVRVGCRGRERHYTPMWVEDRTDFSDIHITQYMLWDHFPNNNGTMIRKTLKEALEAEGRISFGGGHLLDAENPKLEV